jgi:hypothetical protein
MLLRPDKVSVDRRWNLAGRATVDNLPRSEAFEDKSEVRLTIIRKVIPVAALICALAAPAAHAEVRILASPGGQVGPFLDLFERVRNSGERVVIDGPCLSACTLVLSMVPSERICVTRRAVLGFHAARSMDRRGRLYPEREASHLVLQTYPAGVRNWILRRGGLTSRLLLLHRRELTSLYPTCR